MNSLHVEGIWWLPERPEDAVSGTLKFDATKHASLELIGYFGDETDAVFDVLGQSPAPSIIHGVAEGKSITLLHIANGGSKVSMPGTVYQRYFAALVLVGDLIPSPEQVRFERMSLDYTHLNDWSNHSGLQLTIETRSLKASFQQPEDVVVDLPNCSLGLRTRGSVRSNSNEYTISETTALEITPFRPLSFDDYWTAYIHPLRNFLTLATAHPNAPTQVTGTLMGTNPEGEAWNKVEVLFALNNSPTEKSLSRDDMIFDRDEVQQELPAVLARWLEISDELSPVCDLLFGVRYNPRMYTTHRFLNLVQGLEAYHRRRGSNHVLPKEEHKKRVSDVLSAVHPDHRDWLTNALTWSNEPNLKDRLEDVSRLVGPAVSALIPDPEVFIRRVRDTRNYLTHFDARLGSKAAEGAELHRLALQVQFMLVACLLVEVGFSVDKIKTLFARNQEFITTCHG